MKKATTIFSLIVLVGLNACVGLKHQALFDAPSSQIAPEGIDRFYALKIYDDNLTSEIWYTQSPKCLSVKKVDTISYSGNSALLLTWDKQAGGCPWLGIGFGWDGWNPKDLSSIIDKAAVQMKVRSPKGTIKNLPLAAAFEDYSGAQA
jgi:hypothetical protein